MSVSSAQPLLGARTLRLDVLVVALATTYVTVSTTDVKLAGVPLKLFAVLAALGTWLVAARPWERARMFRFRVPVLLAGVGVPVAWFAIAAVLAHGHDPAQRDGLSNAVQEASRFVYLLLYFPLADRQWLGSGWERLWVWPAVLLCAITVGLLVGYLLGADYGTTGTVGPFQGSIGLNTSGTFRDFLVNDIVFLPLFAVLLARGTHRAASRVTAGGLVLVLGCAYLAHARGLWIGICVTTAVVALAAIPRTWPARVRRSAWSLAGLFGLGALVLVSDPDLARGLVRMFTARGELSTALRLDQAPQLLHGFRRDVVVGSGLGATLPSGFVRDPTTPWTFELTYLQLLFEVGAVGIALVLSPALSCLWRIARSLRSTALADRPMGFALLGGLAGFLLAAAGNPYLLTSVGMYTLAVFVAAAEREVAEPAISRGVGRAGGAALAVAVIAVVGLTALEFRASRTGVGDTAGMSPTIRLAVPADAKTLLRQPLASEPGRPRLWSFASQHGRLVATSLTVIGGQVVVGSPRALGPSLAGVGYQVADWHGAPAAFELRAQRSSLALRAISLSGHPRVVAETQGSLPPLTASWHRDVAVAAGPGGTVEVVAVDRSRVRDQLRVSWFPVTPGSRPRTHESTAATLGQFAASRWALQIGSVTTAGPDIVLIRKAARTELQAYVLTPAGAFGERQTIGLGARDGRSLGFILGNRGGAPVLFAIDPARATVEEIGL